MLGARRIHDQIGGGDAVDETPVDGNLAFVGLEPRDELVGRFRGDRLWRRSLIHDVDVFDPVVPIRVDDFGLAGEQAALRIQRNQERVRAIGDVLNQPRRQPEQRAVVIDRGVETALELQHRTGKHQVADAAIRKVEGLAGCLELADEGL